MIGWKDWEGVWCVGSGLGWDVYWDGDEVWFSGRERSGEEGRKDFWVIREGE